MSVQPFGLCRSLNDFVERNVPLAYLVCCFRRLQCFLWGLFTPIASSTIHNHSSLGLINHLLFSFVANFSVSTPSPWHNPLSAFFFLQFL